MEEFYLIRGFDAALPIIKKSNSFLEDQGEILAKKLGNGCEYINLMYGVEYDYDLGLFLNKKIDTLYKGFKDILFISEDLLHYNWWIDNYNKITNYQDYNLKNNILESDLDLRLSLTLDYKIQETIDRKKREEDAKVVVLASYPVFMLYGWYILTNKLGQEDKSLFEIKSLDGIKVNLTIKSFERI